MAIRRPVPGAPRRSRSRPDPLRRETPSGPWPCLALLGALAAFVACGCHTAPHPEGSLADAPGLSPPGAASRRPPARTIPVEVFFVRCPEDAGERMEGIWARVDEQAIDDDVRHRLAANGLRAGILTGPIPEPIVAAAEPALGEETDSSGAGTVEVAPPVVRRVLRLLPGRESEVVSLKAAGHLVVMERDAEGLHGASYSDALPHIALRAWPAADGRMRVDLVPVIRHGPVERTWIGEDGAFKVETGQRRHVLDSLRCEAVVPIDGMLVVGPAGQSAGTVGDALFRPRGDGRREVRLLAMRPHVPGVDPMFALAAAPDETGPTAADAPPTTVSAAETLGR